MYMPFIRAYVLYELYTLYRNTKWWSYINAIVLISTYKRDKNMAQRIVLKPPFSLIRHALSHAKFDNSKTRGYVSELLDKIEKEIDDDLGIEFQRPDTLEAVQELQMHLIELLTLDDTPRNVDDSIGDESRKPLSLGDIEDGNDEESPKNVASKSN
jgi:hypothetical protein